MSAPGPRPRDMVRALSLLGDAELWRELRRLSPAARQALHEEWLGWAHDGQLAPPGGDWRVWLIRAGRGFGKTRAGAEWVHSVARGRKHTRIALVGATAEEARRVMVEGDSGLLATARDADGFEWRGTMGEARWKSGARAAVYSADAPDALRGPQHHAAWCDEIAKWRRGDAAWDNLLMGLRLGDRPRAVVTTTPRPNALMRRIMAMEGKHETTGRTRDNLNLPGVFVAEMERSYGGTRLGRQELDGELIEDVEGALWTRDLLERARVDAAPELARVVVGVDPPASTRGDACGIVAAGAARDGRVYVLEDATVRGVAPEGWARAVAACAARWHADKVVAEANQGGEMVRSVLEGADAMLPIQLVHATRGKAARAEPVQVIYARGRAFHAGRFPELEDQLCGLLTAGGYDGPGRSPDRADACVWALWALTGAKGAEPSVRWM